MVESTSKQKSVIEDSKQKNTTNKSGKLIPAEQTTEETKTEQVSKIEKKKSILMKDKTFQKEMIMIDQKIDDHQDFVKDSKKKWEAVDEKILTKYDLIMKMGRGNYGMVWKAIDKRNRAKVAIKKINNAFGSIVDAQRTLREILILKELGKHNNIMRLHNVRRASNNKDIYLILEFIECDLLTLIRSNFCTNDQRVYIMWQIARGLKFLHSANILHRDIKPSNICINQDCTIKITDFGLSRVLNIGKRQKNVMMTDYVATRWYRAPEILLGSAKYSFPIDIWAFGCVLAELYLNQPIFPGTSTLNQISKILLVTGIPSEELCLKMSSPLTMGMFNNLYIKEHHKSIA